MTGNRVKAGAGFTLIEVMFVLAIVTIASLGALSFRYYAALEARKAIVHATAARIAMLLCESWRGIEGAPDYDPTQFISTNLSIEKRTGPTEYYDYDDTDDYTPFNVLGTFKVTSSDTGYYPLLAWKDIDTNLRVLTVIVACPRPTNKSEYDSGYYVYVDRDQDAGDIVKLTTYVNTN